MLVHLFVNPHADGSDSTKTQPSNWNAEHAFSGSNTGSLLYRDVLASNGANWLTPSPSPGYALISSGAGAPPTWGPVVTPIFPLAATAGGTGVANNVANTITFSGNFGLTLTLSGATSVTFPTSGTLLSTTSPALTANAIVLGGGSGVVPTVVGSLGTTTTLLHGNAAGAPTFGSVVNADITNATIDLTTKVTGTLPVGNGGTGVATLAAHGIVIGNGAGVVTVSGAGTVGQALMSNGASADPTFQGPVGQVTILTGTQNDFALTADCRILRCNNATLLSLTGFAAGYHGQRVLILSVGAGQVDISNQGAGSLAANRVSCFVTSGLTSLSAGKGTCEIVYDATAVSWKLAWHKQGAWIAPAFSAGNFTATGSMTWTVAGGQMTTAKYLVEGSTVYYTFAIDGSTLGGTASAEAQIAKAAYGGYSGISQTSNPIAFVSDGSGTLLIPTQIQMNAGSVSMRILKNSLANWTLGAFTLYISGSFEAA